MRNLKRALSLALATLMVLSMMVVGAGAANLSDFSDEEKIANKEAVSVLTTLNVINGKDDGTYDPEGIVTRAEMAKMICVILNGGKDPQLGQTLKNSYTDTASSWAAPYIEYCTTLGIVSGRGNGTFDPSGTVSVAEAGKMVLVALGYNAGVEGYTGTNWQINVDVRANALGLYDDLGTLNTNVDLTRDNAAQMVYNALDLHLVEYNYVITGNVDNSITTKPQLNDKNKGTLLWEKFGAVKVSGAVVGNEFADLSSTKDNGSALDDGKTEIVVNNNGDDQSVYANKTYTFSVASDEDVLGKAVYLYVKPATNSSNAQKAEVIGSVILSDDNTIVTDASGDTAAEVADDNNLDITDKTTYVYNYANSTTKAPTKDSEFDGVKGIQKTLVDVDSDGDVDYVLYKEMGLGKVALYSEAKDGQIVITVAGNKNLTSKDKDDVVGFDDVEKDDYVLAAYFGGKLYVQKAETVTGTIEAYKLDGDDTVGYTVDGETYDVSFVKTTEADVTAAKDKAGKTILSSEATFYMDLNGFVVARGEVEENAYKFAYVWAAVAGDGMDDGRVKVTTEDGKTKNYDLSSKSEITVVEDIEDIKDTKDEVTTASATNDVQAKDMVGKVYSYTLTSSGDIKLYNPKGEVAGTDPVFTKGLTNIQLVVKDTERYYTGNSTTFFYVTMKDDEKTVKSVDVYNGRNNAPSVDGTTGSAVLALRNATDVGAVAFTGVKVSESAGDHMFVYDANYIWEDYGYVNAFFNGKTEATKDVKITEESGKDVEDGIYLYKTTSEGYYELTELEEYDKTTGKGQTYYVTGEVSRVNKANNTFVIEKNGKFYKELELTKDSVVVDYDSDNSDPVAYTNGSVSVGDKVDVIMNNADDAEVLMAAIMSRKDYSDYTIADAKIVADDGSGEYAVEVKDSANKGDTVTVTVKQTKAPASGTDTFALTSKTVDVVVDKSDANTFTFKMPAKDVKDLTLTVTHKAATAADMFTVAKAVVKPPVGYDAKDYTVTVSPSGRIEAGKTVTVTVTGIGHETGRDTYTLTANGAKVEQVNTTTFTFTMPAADVNNLVLTATHEYAVTAPTTVVGSGENGAGTYTAVTVDKATAAKDEAVKVTVTVTAPVAGTDTITLSSKAHDTITGTTTVTKDDVVDATKTIEFTMPEADVNDLVLTVVHTADASADGE